MNENHIKLSVRMVATIPTQPFGSLVISIEAEDLQSTFDLEAATRLDNLRLVWQVRSVLVSEVSRMADSNSAARAWLLATANI